MQIINPINASIISIMKFNFIHKLNPSPFQIFQEKKDVLNTLQL